MAQRPAESVNGQALGTTDHWLWLRNWMSTILHNATVGPGEFAVAERALLEACGFRAAAAAHAFSEGDGSSRGFDLRYMGLVYEALGAKHVARLLQEAHRDLSVPMQVGQRRTRLLALETALEDTPDPLDQLLARFAEGLR
jgi:hypothetical protein